MYEITSLFLLKKTIVSYTQMIYPLNQGPNAAFNSSSFTMQF